MPHIEQNQPPYDNDNKYHFQGFRLGRDELAIRRKSNRNRVTNCYTKDRVYTVLC